MKRDEIIHISETELKAQQRFAEEFKALPGRPQTYYIVTYGSSRQPPAYTG